MEKKYSVLMSVCAKEKPEYLKLSMESMFNQTIEPDEFVLVCDGPLSDELNKVIEKLEKEHPKTLKVVRLDENRGLGIALSEGIINCKNELIARMDSDDVAKKDRCEKQLKCFEEHPEYGIVGGNIEEFLGDVENVNYMRCVPENQKDIMKFLKKRSPFNHPAVMYKKSLVLKSGNYKSVRHMQDYFLWVDMLSNGVQAYNIQETLVFMRADDLYKRRSGFQYFKIQKQLLDYMKSKKIINIFDYLTSFILRTASCLSPNFIRKFVFVNVLRKKKA